MSRAVIRKTLRDLSRPRELALLTLLLCWTSCLLGPVSYLILPMLALASIGAVLKRGWLPLFFLLIFNPLSIFFVGGVVAYAAGAPTLWFVGLPSIEFFNPDRSTRCFKDTSGCLVYENEWVFQDSHNAAVRLMAALFGCAGRCYDGPYPTREEALKLTDDSAVIVPAREFLTGNIALGEGRAVLDADMLKKLVRGLHLYGFIDLEEESNRSVAKTALFKERCLIIRLVETYSFSAEDDGLDNDAMVFIDRMTGRPFAYYDIKGGGLPRSQPVGYLQTE